MRVRVSATDGAGSGDVIEAGLDDLTITTTTGAAPCTNTGITDATYTTGNIPASCQGTAQVVWTNIPSVPTSGTGYSRCRLTTDTSFFSDASPSATGAVIDGEIEDDLLTFTPTAVTIGRIELMATPIADLFIVLGVDAMSRDDLLDLLATWDADAAVALANATAGEILAALSDYLDPDGDGQVAVLRWDTLEERGTIGFYVERQVDGDSWNRINNGLLPGMITAPMGAEYLLADPDAQAGTSYQYRLIEQEATGTTREYGPFVLEMR